MFACMHTNIVRDYLWAHQYLHTYELVEHIFFCWMQVFFVFFFIHLFIDLWWSLQKVRNSVLKIFEIWKIKGIINPPEHVHMNSSCLSRTLYVRRNILVSQWLKPSNVLVVIACISAQFPVVELDFADWFSTASDPFGCQVSCRISTEWDCQFKYSLAKTVKLEVLACSFHTNFNYVTSLE